MLKAEQGFVTCQDPQKSGLLLRYLVNVLYIITTVMAAMATATAAVAAMVTTMAAMAAVMAAVAAMLTAMATAMAAVAATAVATVMGAATMHNNQLKGGGNGSTEEDLMDGGRGVLPPQICGGNR
jgi:hypothetical protein